MIEELDHGAVLDEEETGLAKKSSMMLLDEDSEGSEEFLSGDLSSFDDNNLDRFAMYGGEVEDGEEFGFQV
jgi:methionyl-tRNA formyltransferase